MLAQFQGSRAAAPLEGIALFTAGQARQLAFHHVERAAALKIDKPMIVAVSRDVTAVYAGWRARATAFAAFFAVLAAGSGLALHFSQKRRRAAGEIAAAVARERQSGAARMEQALRGADLGLWDLHVPSNRVVVNVRERSLLGFLPDEELPSGKLWRRLIHPDDLATVDAAILPHLRGEAPAYEIEHRMRHKDGHWVWLFSRAMIVERDGDNRPVRIVGTHLDVTERRRIQEELVRAGERLRDSEEQLREVTDNMPALVSRVDRDLRFQFVNRAYRDWLQIEPASMLGRTLGDVYGEAAFSGFRHHVEAALAGQRVVYQRELATPTGPLQIEVTLVPQRDSAGQVQGYYALMNNITARFRAERDLARSEERLSLALEASDISLFDWDIASGRLYHSAKAASLRGAAAVETVTTAREQQAFVHPDDLLRVLDRVKDAVTGVSPRYDAEFRIQTVSGGWLWIRARGRVVEHDDQGRAVRLAGTYMDINERKLGELHLRQLAEFDTLTGLPNRALFQDRLRQAMLRARRGMHMAVMFIDIDHFKSINDTLGHEAGDSLLKVFAERMSAVVRQSDTVARLGGDEFTVLLEALSQPDDATMLADKMVSALRVPTLLAGTLHTVTVTVSIGVALFAASDGDEATLLRRADEALYQAKRQGRDNYVCHGQQTRDPVH